MFKFVRVPEKLDAFFDPLRDHFLWKHFEYFRVLVLTMAAAWGRRTVSALYRHWAGQGPGHRTRWNNLLNLHRWDAQEALRQKAYQLLQRLKPHKGDVVEMVLDDSNKCKRGKQMQAVGWVHDAASGRVVRGHLYVAAVLRFRGYVIAWGIRLYIKKEHCRALRQPFRKITQLAAELIEWFCPPDGVRVRVLFDSYYLCDRVVKACRRRRFRFVSTIKTNRNLYKNGRPLKTAAYGLNLFRRGPRRHVSIRKSRGLTLFQYVDAHWMDVGNLGRLHVVFSRRPSYGKALGIVTDDPNLSAQGIIRAYDVRFGVIEVFFKDTKQLVGLGQYQNGSVGAAVTHLHLLCFAYALLTHIAIDREGEQGKRHAHPAAVLSTAERQNELRRIIWRDLADHLTQFHDATALLQELNRLLVA